MNNYIDILKHIWRHVSKVTFLQEKWHIQNNNVDFIHQKKIGNLFGVVIFAVPFLATNVEWQTLTLKIVLHGRFIVTFEFCSESQCKSYPLCLCIFSSVCVSFFMSRFLFETPRSLMFYFLLSLTSLSFLKVGKLYLGGVECIESDLHLNLASWSSEFPASRAEAEDVLTCTDPHHLWCVTAVYP